MFGGFWVLAFFFFSFFLFSLFFGLMKIRQQIIMNMAHTVIPKLK